MGLIVRISCTIILYLLLSILGQCETSIYPGLRRKPLSQALQQQQQQQQQQQAYEISDTDFLSQLMEENARRRLQQQFEQQLELINMQLERQRQREQQARRLERERERYKQNQLQRQRQKQQMLNAAANWQEQHVMGNAEDNLEYATSYTYDKNKQRMGSFEKYDLPDTGYNSYNNKYTHMKLAQGKNQMLERIPFAVPPSDPRFYVNENNDYIENADNDLTEQDDIMSNGMENAESAEDLDPSTLAEYKEYVPAQITPHVIEIKPGSGTHDSALLTDKAASASSSFPAAVNPTATAYSATFHRIKPASAVAAAAVVAGVKQQAGAQNVLRHDLNAYIDKLQNKQITADTANAAAEEPHLVVRHYLGMNEGDWGIYIVALVAGLSAAVTVGVIALALAWMHNKAKAAADVEYPAYGVTGPNRDISPSGDRKLAQSAQMYHYQHQKQQIMAMENRQVEAGMSDVESDDDNEEGDYTVYECPGLAPTGEMEVKNPLFLDETPVTTPSATTNATSAAGINTTTTTTTTSNNKPITNHVQTATNLKHKKNQANDLNVKTQSSDTKKKDNKK